VEMSSLPPESEAHKDERASTEKSETHKSDAPEAGKADEDKTVVPFLNAKAEKSEQTAADETPVTAAGADAEARSNEAPDARVEPVFGPMAKVPEPVTKQDPPMQAAAIGSALVPFVPKNAGAEDEKFEETLPPRAGFLQSRAMQAAVLAAFIGVGWAAAGSFMGSHTTKPAPSQHLASAVAATPVGAESAGETKKLNDDVKALKKEVETLRAALARNGNGEEIRSLKRSVESVKDGMESTKADVANSLAQLSGKVEKMQHDPGKLREINDRLDHIEKQSPVTTASIAPVQAAEVPKSAPIPLPPTKTAIAKPEAPVKDAAKEPAKETVAKAETPAPAASKPQTATPAPSDKPQLLTNWVVRDVYRGIALVEGPHGSIEVVPGETIPGAGTVKSIEKRGGSWIVLTSRGLVDSARY